MKITSAVIGKVIVLVTTTSQQLISLLRSRFHAALHAPVCKCEKRGCTAAGVLEPKVSPPLKPGVTLQVVTRRYAPHPIILVLFKLILGFEFVCEFLRFI